MLRSALALSLLALLPFAGCGDGSSDSGFSLTGAPNIIVTPNPIAFQALSIGESRTIEVTVENAADASGVLDLEPVQLLATPDLVLEQPLKFTLVQGDSTTLKLTYTPSDEEPDSGYLVFKWRGSVEQYQVPIVTAAQAGVLTLSPSPVKFGEVPGGTPKVIGVRAVNAGSSPLDIGPLTVTGSPDFRVIGLYALEGSDCTGLQTDNTLTTPFEVEPNGGFCIDVEYKPFGGGDDVGLLAVNPPFDPALPVQDPIATAALQGSEIGPEIALNPVELNFGPLDVGETKDLTFNIENQGNADLVIAAVQKGESNFEIFDAISIVPEVAADSVVAPSSTTGLTVTVRFNPTKNYPVTYSTIGFLEVLSNDADEPIAYVKIAAQTKSAKLQVTPTPLIDFGIVAEATPGSTRTVTFTNVGTSDLEVTGLAIENNAENEFTIDEVVEDPMVIQANSYRIVNLRYKNTGGAEGDIENAKLVFASTDQDPAAPTSVNLRATRAKKAFCAIKLEPVKVNFGTIGYGLEKKMTLNVTNVGSAPCSPFSVSVDDGPGTLFPGFPTGNCRIPTGDKSNAFFVTNEPPAIKDLLQPGQSLPLQVKFAPTASIWSSISLDGLTEFKGIVHVTMLDYANPDLVNGTDYTVVSEPPGKVGDEVICNLEAKSGVANIAAIPGEVAFAKTTVGCFSKTQDIKVYNTGKAPIDLCGIELEGCGPEFKLKNVPAIPPCVNGVGGIKLTEATPINFGVVYVPQDTSKDGCSIVILSNDAETPGLTIPLEGEGTYDTTQTDEYTQLSGQQVDVLFIVDNSGSMSEEQSSLGSNISSFVAQAAQWQTDYHIGVVSTDVDETNTEAGWLQDDGGSQKRYFTSGTGTSGFASTVKSLGTNGSGTEQGLEAARMALSFPITAQPADPPKTCNADADCTKPQVCVPSVLNAGTKVCAGWNWEFLRPDAVLELVFVSDEEDGSSGNLSFYIDFFKSIKGFANTGLFHAHSIVGDEGSGCTSSSGDAAAGDRYIELSKQTNGKIRSICDSNWADILKDIGTIAFGLKVQFFLSRPPIPETIVVKVAGSACTTGWEYQEDTNSILFDQNHPCMPQENETIQITYDVLCYSE